MHNWFCGKNDCALCIVHYELSIMHYELCIMLSRSAFKATEFALEFGFEDAFFAADDGAAI